jgi:hypothetical protein
VIKENEKRAFFFPIDSFVNSVVLMFMLFLSIFLPILTLSHRRGMSG